MHPFPTKRFINRVKLVVSNPIRCWDTITSERTRWQELVFSYTLPLSSMGACASFIECVLIRPSGDVGAADTTLSQISLFCVGLVIASIIFHVIAAQLAVRASRALGGSGDLDSGMQLVAHAATPAMLGWSMSFVPLLGSLLPMCSLFSLFLLYVGSGPLLRLPREQQAIFAGAAFFAGALCAGLFGFFFAEFVPRTSLTPS
jgi:hypothetical protein